MTIFISIQQVCQTCVLDLEYGEERVLFLSDMSYINSEILVDLMHRLACSGARQCTSSREQCSEIRREPGILYSDGRGQGQYVFSSSFSFYPPQCTQPLFGKKYLPLFLAM